MKGSLFYRFMCWYDQAWRRWHNVEKIDDLVSLSFEKHTGERRAMNDGTWIEPGDCLAILHFNRECFTEPAANAREYTRSALRFRKLLIASFSRLALRVNSDENLKRVKALHGVSWLPPHGEKVGFMIERMPDSFLNRVRKFYFRLLLKTFFPLLAARENARLQPHGFWLTRQNLLKYFSKEFHNKVPHNQESHNNELQSGQKRDGSAGGFIPGPVESGSITHDRLGDYS